MARFFKYFALTLGFCAALFSVLYGVSYLFPGFDDVKEVKKVADFDFAGYAFGLVAVAVSVSGIYVSIVPESCIGQLKSRVAVHLTPAPFADWLSIRDQCEHRDGLKRPPQVKALYVLSIWGTIGPKKRHELLEADGLDEAATWFNESLEWFDKQSDRLIAETLGASVSALYLLVPIVDLLLPSKYLFVLLSSIYVLCVIDVAACANLYGMRVSFVGRFDGEAKHWLPTCDAYLAATASPPPSPLPPPLAPAIMGVPTNLG